MAEFLLVVSIPLLWAGWELVVLARSRPRSPDREPRPSDPSRTDTTLTSPAGES